MPAVLLLCVIAPLVKDPSGSLDDSSNFRGIAISSLFLKVWDLVIIMQHADDLGSDELQFGFKKCSSWSVVETIKDQKSLLACWNVRKLLIWNNNDIGLISLILILYIFTVIHIHSCQRWTINVCKWIFLEILYQNAINSVKM